LVAGAHFPQLGSLPKAELATIEGGTKLSLCPGLEGPFVAHVTPPPTIKLYFPKVDESSLRCTLAVLRTRDEKLIKLEDGDWGHELFEEPDHGGSMLEVDVLDHTALFYWQLIADQYGIQSHQSLTNKGTRRPTRAAPGSVPKDRYSRAVANPIVPLSWHARGLPSGSARWAVRAVHVRPVQYVPQVTQHKSWLVAPLVRYQRRQIIVGVSSQPLGGGCASGRSPSSRPAREVVR
jgi:hypothetical protein